MTEPAIGVAEFYRRLYEAVLDSERAGVYTSVSVFGVDAATAAGAFAAEHGITVEHDEFDRNPNVPSSGTIKCDRIRFPGTGSAITVHLP